MSEFRSVRVHAIVLRHADWGEADRLVTLFTREQGKLRAWRGIGGDDSGYSFVPVAVESYGRLGVRATRLLSEIADVAARGGAPKGAFVRMAHAQLSCALVKGMGKVYASSMQATVRAAGRAFQDGNPVPVADTVSE